MTPNDNIQTQTLSRRAMLLKSAGGLGAAALFTLSNPAYANLLQQGAAGAKLNGRLKQSACRWCYRNIPLEDLAKFASEIGLKGIDLLN
ncbi:MAG TPA: hydroxypyruvate isomerase, partial [Blastocatellia bacterium]